MVRGRHGQFFPWLLALTNYNSSTRFPRLTGRALLRDRAKDRLGVGGLPPCRYDRHGRDKLHHRAFQLLGWGAPNSGLLHIITRAGGSVQAVSPDEDPESRPRVRAVLDARITDPTERNS